MFHHLPPALERDSAWVGLAYLKQAYRTSPRDPHYLTAVSKMHAHLQHAGVSPQAANPFLWLIAPEVTADTLLHNLPHMQVSLNVAIDRTRHSVSKVRAALRQLRRS